MSTINYTSGQLNDILLWLNCCLTSKINVSRVVGHSTSAQTSADLQNIAEMYCVKSQGAILRSNEARKVLARQGCNQPHSPEWARVPHSLFFLQVSINFSHISLNVSHFLPQFGPPDGRLAH